MSGETKWKKVISTSRSPQMTYSLGLRIKKKTWFFVLYKASLKCSCWVIVWRNLWQTNISKGKCLIKRYASRSSKFTKYSTIFLAWRRKTISKSMTSWRQLMKTFSPQNHNDSYILEFGLIIKYSYHFEFRHKWSNSWEIGFYWLSGLDYMWFASYWMLYLAVFIEFRCDLYLVLLVGEVWSWVLAELFVGERKEDVHWSIVQKGVCALIEGCNPNGSGKVSHLYLKDIPLIAFLILK